MSLRRQQSKFVRLVSKLIIYSDSIGYELTFGDAWAKDGHKDDSNHYIRLAIDFNLFIDGVYQRTTEAHQKLGEYWESLDPNARWGGRWNDGNHYELIYIG